MGPGMNGPGTVIFWRVMYGAAAAVALVYAAPLSEKLFWKVKGRFFQGPAEKSATRPLPLGGDIRDGRERRDIQKVSAEYGRVKVLVDVARSKGKDVAKLDQLLIYSLSLAKQQKYSQALTMLNRIEMGIPRDRERVAVSRIDDPLPKEPELKAKPLPKADPKGGAGERTKRRRKR